ncbi:MAG: hypothetical protein SOW25_03315 [Helicobacter sp.]|nr:hypothetical protein [Helicobacter sp.]
MVFSSYVFIFAFLPLMLFGFYLLKHFRQDFLSKVFLVLGSLFFYAFWEVKYLALILFSIVVNYAIANKIVAFAGGAK